MANNIPDKMAIFKNKFNFLLNCTQIKFSALMDFLMLIKIKINIKQLKN